MKALVQKTGLYALLFFTAFSGLAQEKKVDVDINVGKETNWYQQPWVWVIGVAVFILVLVALLRRRD